MTTNDKYWDDKDMPEDEPNCTKEEYEQAAPAVILETALIIRRDETEDGPLYTISLLKNADHYISFPNFSDLNMAFEALLTLQPGQHPIADAIREISEDEAELDQYVISPEQLFAERAQGAQAGPVMYSPRKRG